MAIKLVVSIYCDLTTVFEQLGGPNFFSIIHSIVINVFVQLLFNQITKEIHKIVITESKDNFKTSN